MLAVFSPDGRWIAYESDEDGDNEVWVREFPEGRKVKVSCGERALKPVWNESGLYDDARSDWMPVEDRDPGPVFDPAPPRLLRRSILFNWVGRPNYDVSRDGTRVLVPIDEEILEVTT